MDLTDANFQKEVLESDKPVLVDFWAPWCGPCQIIKPIMEDLIAEYADKDIVIGKMNVDENGETASKFGIMSLPSFKVFKGGKIVNEAVGGIGRDGVVKLIESALE